MQHMLLSQPQMNILWEMEGVPFIDRGQVVYGPRGPRPVASGWGKRRLQRFKTVNGKRFQLHATRGWKPA